MTEYTMKNGVLVPGTSRRTFMKALGTLFTGAVVAPVIVPYASMMHIDSPTNRLVFAYTSLDGEYIKSFLNLGECMDPLVRAQWERQNSWYIYEFVRAGEILSKNDYRFGGFTFRSVDGGFDKELYLKSAREMKRRVAAFKDRGSSYHYNSI